MTPLTFVSWKWAPKPGYRSTYRPETVLVLRNMIARNYRQPFRFVCVTDDPRGLGGIETIPMWSDHATVETPYGSHNPSCYRRLKAFAPDARDYFGDRLVSMDLDTVITGDITDLFERAEDFVCWGESDFPQTQWYNGSLWYLKTGTRPQVWTRFDPDRSPAEAKAAGAKGSDQGWISYVLGPNEAKFSKADGVYSFRKDVIKSGLPKNARVICFHGPHDPWSVGHKHDWIRRHYR